MENNKKGVSLIALIITVAVIIIIAGTIIQNGLQRTDEARLATHNTNISITQEAVESYYYYKEAELPVVNLTPYPIKIGTTLHSEITKNGEQADSFYVVDLSKLGKVELKEGIGSENNIYIVSSIKHNIYYVKGTVVKGVVYHGLAMKNTGNIAQYDVSYKYDNPIVPAGFTHIGSETWDTGFTIEDLAGNQFVWVPALAEAVKENGTLDGINFNSKFGRRNYGGVIFDLDNYYETNDAVLQNITKSVNKYGGFYISKYEASNNGSGKGQSKANVAPWVNIDWNTSKEKAESMDTDWGWDTNVVESYLCYGAHWDTTLQWLIDSKAKSLSEVTSDSTSWGNYLNANFIYGAGLTKTSYTGTVIKTGVDTDPKDRHMAKGIYDLAGNVDEWTMESIGGGYRVCRGGYYADSGDSTMASYRSMDNIPEDFSNVISWRSVLYIK